MILKNARTLIIELKFECEVLPNKFLATDDDEQKLPVPLNCLLNKYGGFRDILGLQKTIQ